MIAPAHVVLALATSLTSAWWAYRLLPHLPEPDADPLDEFVKPRYSAVATPLFAAVTALCALASGTLCCWIPSWPISMAWALLAGGGSVLALVDLRTTYLPARLLRPLTAAIALVLVIAVLVIGVESPARALDVGVRIVVGGAASRLLFWCIWRLSAGIGFGDVRLAGLLGMVTGAISTPLWCLGLLLGTLLGSVWAIAVLAYRRRRPSPLGTAFAYGPALVLGCWLALACG